jgi:hypothetical protein
MPFTTPLLVRHVDPTTWELVAPLSYQGRVDHWTIPSGYRTDFATVPWFVQWLVPRTGVWTLAATLHDWFITDGIPAGLITSRQTDGVFRRVLREEGTDPVRRWLMWAAVRTAAPFSKGRRPSQFWRDAPAVAAIGAAAATTAACVAYLADRAVHALL